MRRPTAFIGPAAPARSSTGSESAFVDGAPRPDRNEGPGSQATCVLECAVGVLGPDSIPADPPRGEGVTPSDPEHVLQFLCSHSSAAPDGAAPVDATRVSVQPQAFGRLQARILVVDDSPDIRRLVSLRLRKVGAEVELAENGAVAVDKARAAIADKRPYDVILMDMQMPELDGYEATRQLRAEGYQRPIVAVTAYALIGDREKCLAAGCSDYVPKPIDFRRMYGLIKRVTGA
jgi:CheY-like chemotaxis protein